ncbi:MAG: Protein-export rane protein SecF [Candidatus Kaiserbacteria bacterium]|nr:Protein-export rane protein SecF [Candidatus Kaiserbacteria bacterium]
MFITHHRRPFFILTGLIIAASIASFAFFGLRFGIDFTGGTLAQVTYNGARPDSLVLTQSLDTLGLKDISIRASGDHDYIIRSDTLTEIERTNLPKALSIEDKYPVTVSQLDEIGPTIGAELRAKALWALVLVLLCILLFIAYAFRQVSKPVSSWVYGLIALVTLVHDVIVPIGFFAILGHYTGAAVDTLFVTAVLTVLGFSIHDTIVVFDRVRENLRINSEANRKESFTETAGRALNQTFVRSINTSLTVLFTLLVLYVYGPASTHDFALTLLVGIIAGTYSSIFLATPLLVEIAHRQGKKN